MKINLHNFWLYQVSGWVFYFLINVLQIFSSRIIHPKKFLTELIEALAGFLLTTLIRFYYKKIDFHTHSIFYLIIRITLLSIITSFVWFFLIYFNRSYVINNNVHSVMLDIGILINWITILSPIIFSWSSLYFGLKFWLEWDQQKTKVEQANSTALEARLEMLRYQLNPHFLFNALNSVKALIGENDKNAVLMITELSDFLRYPLIHKNDKVIPLHEEINAIRNLLSIEKRRFEEKLNTTIDIDSRIEDFKIPGFILYPLVENAVKYGMKTSKMPVEILIKAEKINGNLKISIINTGTWVNSCDQNNHDGTGTGIENVKLRLKNIFPGKYKFHCFEKDEKVHITIELEKLSEN
jgi:LytS/YehU family sensor histidine kinase